MVDGINGILVCYNQAERIAKHPLETSENLIVIDNLEAGKLRLFEYIGGPLYIQQLLWNNRYQNAVLVAQAVINEDWKENGIFVHRIFNEYGYEYLVEPMLDQILHFYEFYNDSRPLKISKIAYDNCFPFAKDFLAGFQKEGSIYTYHKSSRMEKE